MDEITLNQARELLLIDKHNLDEECITQPSISSSVGDQFITAKSIRDKAKKELAEVDALIAKELRLDADAKGTKLSEAKLQESIILDERHKSAFNIWAEANLTSERWENMKDSFHQRGFMLKDLCSLFYTAYFVKESVNVNKAAVEKETTDIRKKLQENRQRNQNMTNG